MAIVVVVVVVVIFIVIVVVVIVVVIVVVVVVVVVDNHANFWNPKGAHSNGRFSHVRRQMNLFLVPINQKQ